MLALPEAEGAELLVEAMAPPGGVELIVAAGPTRSSPRS